MRRFLFLSLSVILISFISILFVVDISIKQLRDRPQDIPDSFCKTMDTEPPKVVLNGNSLVIIKLGENYEELGGEAIDDCDRISLEQSGTVDVNNAGIYEIKYIAKDSSENKTEAIRIVSVVPEYRGTIFLTFDDGPGPYTAELLDILKKYGVKATFFVTGAGDDSLILREFNEGHAIGLHTYSHNYSYIYQNADNFFEDLNRVQDRVKRITGHSSSLLRFPGGSSNTVSAKYDGGARIMSKLAKEVGVKGFTYFDWNITSGDAGETTSSDQVYQNVIYGLKEGGSSVVLQHDIKSFSVDAVERIIKYGLTNGYEFDKLSTSSFTARHRINN